METAALGRILVLVGGSIVLLGLLLVAGPRIPFLGHLPGDIVVQRDGVTLFLPLGTMLLVSVVLTIIVNVVSRFFR
jgi:hypothetical protein